MDGTVYLMDVRHSMVIFGFSLDHQRDMYCRPPSPIPHRHIPPPGQLPPLETTTPCRERIAWRADERVRRGRWKAGGGAVCHMLR